MSTAAQDAPLFIAYAALVSLALLPIYFGSYQSLRTPSTVIAARKAARQEKQSRSKAGDEEDEDDDDEPAVTETLTSEDAYLFPIIGSLVLFSLYFVFKYLNRKWVDRILGAYFAIVGSAAVFKVALSIAAAIAGTANWKALLQYKLHITHNLTDKELTAEHKQRVKAAEERKNKQKEFADKGQVKDEEIPKVRSEYQRVFWPP